MKTKKTEPTAQKPKIDDLVPAKDAKGGAAASGGTAIPQERTASFFHS